MKIIIVTLGTQGDQQPFLALGLGLQQAGYDVLLVSSKNGESLVKGYGLPYHALNVDVEQAMNNPAVQKMAKGDNPLAFVMGHLSGSDSMQETMTALQEEIWAVCQGSDAIIYHPGMANAFFMAKELGIPSILASPFPLSATRAYPAVLFYNGPRLGALYNRFTHFIFENAFWLLSRSSAKAFWQKRGQPHVISSKPVSRLQARSGMPVLYGYSRYLFPRPPDWPDNIRVTGTWSLPDDPTWEPPVALVNFLQSGQAPVYIGFGSIREADTYRETLGLLVEALAMTRQRAIISLGWNQLTHPEPLPDTIFLLGSAPHSWLFPRVAAVIHHGGAGTTAAGLKAGRPTLIIPHTADQPAWGRRVYELGVGPKPIPRKKLTAKKLAAALGQLSDETIRTKAEKLGQQMQGEYGVADAVKLIDGYLSKLWARSL